LTGLLTLSGCGVVDGVGIGQPPAVITIARDDGSPPPGSFAAEPFAQLRVVPDELADTVVDDFDLDLLPAGEGDPFQLGKYGSIDDLDEGQVLAVWYSGSSGSAPPTFAGSG